MDWNFLETIHQLGNSNKIKTGWFDLLVSSMMHHDLKIHITEDIEVVKSKKKKTQTRHVLDFFFFFYVNHETKKLVFSEIAIRSQSTLSGNEGK